MANRTLPANVGISIHARRDLGQVSTDKIANGSGNYVAYADGVLWDTTNNKAISPEHMAYQAFFATPRS